MSKKKRTPFASYENEKEYERKYIRITHSLLMNKNFLRLKPTSKMLYLYMRDWAYPSNEVTYSISNSGIIMSKNTFLGCIKELENAGFIETIWSNKFSHRPNVYRFINKWYKN